MADAPKNVKSDGQVTAAGPEVAPEVAAAPETKPPLAPPVALSPEAAAMRTLAADNMIKDYVIATVTASIIPVPLLDIASIAAVQLRMTQKLSQLYGKPFSDSLARKVITPLVGSVLGYGGGFAVAASLTKLLPGVGWMIGMASMQAVTGATTYAVGHALMKHYESGGTMEDIVIEASRAYAKEEFEKGKKFVAGIKDKLAGGGDIGDGQAVAGHG